LKPGASRPLDAIDRRLLALLQDDARTPLTTLAKRVGLSRSATQERVARLEKSGVIAGYTLKAGTGGEPPRTQAWLALTFRPGTTCAQLMPQLSTLDGVRLAHSVAGDVDLLVLAEADTIAAIGALREAVAKLPGVAAVKTYAVMAVQLDRR
jgi:Lrp/AsnC family leucine-responsive transcriptional regulator